MGLLKLVNEYAQVMPERSPSVPVVHPRFGYLGQCESRRGFRPANGRWASVKAIERDHSRTVVRTLRAFEDSVPLGVSAALALLLRRNPAALPLALGAIGSYNDIINARASGAMQDVWMAMTATFTPVTLQWYDLMYLSTWVPQTNPSVTGFVNSGTAGVVPDATSNGSWLSNPAGSNRKYIVSLGNTVTSISGISLLMLYDCLWHGQYVITSNVTIAPTSPLTVTRYSATSAGREYAGGNMMQMTLASTLTFSVAGTVTTTYHDQAGAGSKTTIWVPGPTGALITRVVGNTTHNTATVIPSTPFLPLTNSGSSGVTSVDSVAIAGGTITAGTLNHKIVRPLLLMPFIAANSLIEQDATLNLGNMVELHNVSQVCGCLGFNVFSAGTTAVSMSAMMRTAEG